MKKRSLKITILALALMLSIVFCASCSMFKSVKQSTCAHSTVNAANCKSPATCADCGLTSGGLGDHIYVKKVVYPDCTNEGYAEYTCSACGDTYKEDYTVATGHQFGTWEFTKEPTEDEAGEMRRECATCGFKEISVVPAHTHTLAHGEAKAVSCTTDGWNAYQYCTQCEFTTKVIISATGHSYGEYISAGDSTHYRVCANDPSHISSDPCSGGEQYDPPVCSLCHGTYEFAVRAGNSRYGYDVLGTYATYGAGMQKLYKDLTKTCEEFYFSNQDLTLNKNYYIIGEYDMAEYSLDLDAGSAVWKIFYVSNPLYYWLDARIVSMGNSLVLTVADDYARASDRRAADAAIAQITAECSALIKDGMTDLEKAVTITAYITQNMEYAYEKDGTTPVSDMWAHCMAGFALRGLGVCEAYAKTFMYLCLLNGIDCRMGSGYAGEPHAWNYVEIDGVWYGADITWTDNSGDLAVYDYFGLSTSAIFRNHTPHSSTVLSSDFIYAAPTLSNQSIELTALYKNGEYVGLYKSIDDAFAAMTDKTAEYEIKIDYYAFYVESPVHYIRSTTTPDVKKLTITGRNETTGQNTLDNNSIIYLLSSLTLGSDVELRNLYLAVGSGSYQVALDGHTLTLGGDVVYTDTRITGGFASEVVIETTDVAYINGGVDVYSLNTGNVGVLLGLDSYITYCEGNRIFIPRGEDVKVTIIYQK